MRVQISASFSRNKVRQIMIIMTTKHILLTVCQALFSLFLHIYWHNNQTLWERHFHYSCITDAEAEVWLHHCRNHHLFWIIADSLNIKDPTASKSNKISLIDLSDFSFLWIVFSLSDFLLPCVILCPRSLSVGDNFLAFKIKFIERICCFWTLKVCHL